MDATYSDPFAVLGPHATPAGVAIRTVQPGAHKVRIVDEAGGSLALCERLHPDGFFQAVLPGKRPDLRYRLEVEQVGGHRWTSEDPYRLGPVLPDLDVHLLGEGSHERPYTCLGAHPMEIDGVGGTRFAVWAPNASRVALVGSFNDWDGRRHPMRLRQGIGVWELFLPLVGIGDLYKYEIKAADGSLLPLKADPFAAGAEHPPATSSVVRDRTAFDWTDQHWMTERAERQDRKAPMSVYEVHLPSWRRPDDHQADSPTYLTYDELGEQLVEYTKDMGFTHIELLPVTEFPYDGSWGYQPTGLFAPTCRHGSPAEFQALVDTCHNAGLGVILDWVPAHFPSDAHGLAQFDGSHLYEHADPRQGFHKDWNTLIYNFGRREVANFLAASARWWLEECHIDGLRVDAVASMLYLDYSRDEGEWIPNRFGGRENLEAIELLRRVNTDAFATLPGATTIAEESTAWPGVSQPVYAGGLGFGYKWNMGWMHDTLSFMSKDPVHRGYHLNNMTFGLVYAFHENFVLPLSHDEVVHGKGSLLGKMPGDAWQQFANLRAYYGFMWTHPGKKLLFMGGEFAQGREWDFANSLDWHQLEIPAHAGVRNLVRDLNRLYRDTRALHVGDCDDSGFQWLESNDHENVVIAYLRRGGADDPEQLIICNWTPIPRSDYRVGLPDGDGAWRLKLNTDAGIYGGSDAPVADRLRPIPEARYDWPAHVRVDLPPLATVIFERTAG